MPTPLSENSGTSINTQLLPKKTPNDAAKDKIGYRLEITARSQKVFDLFSRNTNYNVFDAFVLSVQRNTSQTI